MSQRLGFYILSINLLLLTNSPLRAQCDFPPTPIDLLAPAFGATGVPLNQVFSWAGGDSQCPKLIATYSVYFGTSEWPEFYGDNGTAKTFAPPLTPGTTYYWRIVAFTGLTATSWVYSFTTLTPTAIGDAPRASSTRLTANVPNPFRGTTEFQFYGDGATSITADVFDVSGRRVATQRLDASRAGWQPIVVTDRDAAGQELSSGVYFVRVRSGGTVATRKMVIMR